MQQAGPGLTGLSRATLTDAQEIVRQAKRYCPNLPFEPDLNEVYERDVPFYEDYRLVRLAPAEPPDQEFYGFYAPGDFRPIDVDGRVFESLNAKAPLILTSRTVLEYALIRLSFQLPALVQDKPPADLKLAKTIRRFDELNVDKVEADNTKLRNLKYLLAEPEIEMIKEWDPYADVVPAEILRGKAYRVSATMMVQLSATEGQLIEVLVQIDPLGSVVIRTDAKSSETFPMTPDKVASISTPRHTATAMPIQDWENLDANESQRMFEELSKYGLQRSPDANNTDFVLRKSNLSFYTRYQLLEVLRWDINFYKRSYAIFKPNGDDFLMVPLTGKSPVIHGINAEEGELNLTDTTAEEYLRFFCWAVRGEAGPFYIPRTYREIPIKANFAGAEQANLKQRDFNVVNEVDPTSHNYEQVPNANFRFSATVVYESAMFEAWFAIESSGMVHMVEDHPLARIPIQTESELGEEFLRASPAEAVKEGPPPIKPALSLAQKVWLSDALTWLTGLLEWIPEEQTSAEAVRKYLSNSANQRFVRNLEKLWPLIPPPSSPNMAHEFIGSLWTSAPPQETVAPKEIASQLTLLTEGLLPILKVTDTSYFSTCKPTISDAQISQAVVFSSALLKTETKQTNKPNDNSK